MDIFFPRNRQFLEDLVLQRTGPFIALGGRPALNDWVATGRKAQLSQFLLECNHVDRFLRAVIDEIGGEMAELIRVVGKERFGTVVSIGPGNGLAELLLFHQVHYSKILLVDIEQSDLHRHGFAGKGAGYASLNATGEFLVSNGVPAESIVSCNPSLSDLPDFPFDVLISLISMGFHYPCDDYVAFIERNVNPGGRIVFDRRAGSPDRGFEQLAATFPVARTMPFPKGNRVFLIRQDFA